MEQTRWTPVAFFACQGLCDTTLLPLANDAFAYTSLALHEYSACMCKCVDVYMYIRRCVCVCVYMYTYVYVCM